jgi:ribosomal protein S1
MAIDPESRKLDLSIKAANEKNVITPDKFSKGMILTGRVAKIMPGKLMGNLNKSMTYSM